MGATTLRPMEAESSLRVKSWRNVQAGRENVRRVSAKSRLSALGPARTPPNICEPVRFGTCSRPSGSVIAGRTVPTEPCKAVQLKQSGKVRHADWRQSQSAGNVDCAGRMWGQNRIPSVGIQADVATKQKSCLSSFGPARAFPNTCGRVGFGTRLSPSGSVIRGRTISTEPCREAQS